jgi:hypothetical protein
MGSAAMRESHLRLVPVRFLIFPTKLLTHHPMDPFVVLHRLYLAFAKWTSLQRALRPFYLAHHLWVGPLFSWARILSNDASSDDFKI